MKIERGQGLGRHCLVLITESPEEVQDILMVLGENVGICGNRYKCEVESVGRAVLKNTKDEKGKLYLEGERIDWLRMRLAPVVQVTPVEDLPISCKDEKESK